MTNSIKSFAPVEGGQPIIIDKEKKTFFTYVRRGKGLVAAAACSSSFTNKEMGETETVPDDDQLFLYKLEFWILSCLMKNNFEFFSSFVL